MFKPFDVCKKGHFEQQTEFPKFFRKSKIGTHSVEITQLDN